MQIVISSSDPVCPVGYINLTKLHLKAKDKPTTPVEAIKVKNSLDYIKNLNNLILSDITDSDLSDYEIEETIKNNDSKIPISLSKDDITLKKHKDKQLEKRNISLESLIHLKDEEQTNKSEVAENLLPKRNEKLFKNEQNSICNTPTGVVNKKGWMWLAGVEGNGETAEEGMISALEKLKGEFFF